MLLTCPNKDKRSQAIDIGVQYMDKILSELKTLSNEVLDEYESYGDYLMNRFKSKFKEFDKDKELCNALKSVFVSLMNNEAELSGCFTLSELDLKGFVNYIDLAGDLSFVLNKRGYSEIVNTIAEDVIEMDWIKLKHEVDNIEQVQTDGEWKFKITCANGNEFYADTTVLTVSVGILKNFVNNGVFSPALPVEKVETVQKLCLGHVKKVYFKFITPFDKKFHYIQFYPAQENFGLPVFKKYNEVYAMDRICDSDWWLLWVNGEALTTEFANNDKTAFTVELIEAIKSIYPTFPDVNIDVESIVASDWTSDPFYQGAYSYLPTGSTAEDILCYGEPIVYKKQKKEINILFCGELTEPEFYSTTHGAYLSGIREGERLKSIYKLGL